MHVYDLAFSQSRTLGYDLYSDRYIVADGEPIIPRLLQASTKLPDQEVGGT